MPNKKGYSITDDKGTGDRKLMLDVLVNMLAQTDRLFYSFRKECKYNKRSNCMHPLYHEDFALVNVCKIENCPIIQHY